MPQPPIKMRRAAFIASPEEWAAGFGLQHPLKPERLKRTFELLQAYDAFAAPNVRLVPARMATEAELGYYHTVEYIDVVRRLSRGERGVPQAKYGLGPGDNPVFPGMFEVYGLAVGGALVAAELLLSGEVDVAFNMAGGLHHGGPDFASGFCIFSDASVVLRWLVQQGLRVAYVDIDVHHGDGVQAAFYDSDRALTISLHECGHFLFPGTGFVDEIGVGAGKGYSVNLPFPPYTDGSIYLPAFEAIVPPLVERFNPDLLVTQLGVDTHYRDPLAQLCLTTNDHLRLFERLESLAPRWLALGGGGYDLGVVPRAWTLAFGVMSGQSFPDQLPASYREKYLGEWLSDRETPLINVSDQARIDREVDSTLSELKRLHRL